MRFTSPTTKTSSGFTLIEVLIVAPIIIIAVSGFVALMVAMVGEVLTTRDRNAITYNAQDALDIIEQDVRLSAEFLTTTSALPSPQGKDSNFTGTAAFTSSDTNTLPLSVLATDENPTSSSRWLIYYANQPSPCGAATTSYNRVFLTKVIYFVKDSALWRRTYVPDYNTNTSSPDANTVCPTPWQQNSCSPGYVASRCQTNDAKLMDDVSTFDVQYFASAGSTSPLPTGSAGSATTIEVSINGQKTVVGNSITTSASRRATKLNNVSSAIPPPKWVSVTPSNNWVTYSTPPFAAPAYTITKDGVVVLKGMIKNGTTTAGTRLFTLPANYRPERTLIFMVGSYVGGSAGSGFGRIDVEADGDVNFYWGSNTWISLDSIRFLATTAPYTWTSLSFQNGWTNFGGTVYSPLKVTKDASTRVHINGLVKDGTSTSGTTIAAMPSNYQPPQHLLIPASDTTNVFGSFGVYSTNNIVARNMLTSYLSTQAMYYPSSYGGWSDLTPLKNGWVFYGSPHATPQYTKSSDGIVTVKGLIKSGTITNGTPVATLPPGYRPKDKLIFPSIGGTSHTRMDVDVNGDIIIAGTGSSNFISLDNISFIAEQ